MKLILADTGPLYALADVSDQYHSRAGQELLAAGKKGYGIAVSYATVCEAYTLVMRRLGGGYARQWLTEVLAGSVLVNPEAGDYLSAADLIGRFPDQPWTMIDALTAILSAKIKAPVWTFDRHFAAMRATLWRA